MSSVGCSTVTLQHDGSERANWWDQSRVAESIKIRSGGKKRKGKQCPYRLGTQGRRLIFILSTFFPALRGVIKQWALLVDSIDVLETSSRWLQSFINENELCLNSFSPCVFLFFDHSVIRFSVFASTYSYFVFPPSGFCFLSLSQSVCPFYISVSNFMPPQHLLTFSPSLSVFPLHRWLCMEYQLNSQCCELQQQNNCYCGGLDMNTLLGIIASLQTVFAVFYLWINMCLVTVK